jgi:hypothetical protein
MWEGVYVRKCGGDSIVFVIKNNIEDDFLTYEEIGLWL